MKMDASAFVADEELINSLKRHSSPIPCGEDRVLFAQGEAAEGLYIILRGEVELTMKSLLGETILEMPAVPGSLLGLPALIGNMTYSLSAVAKAGAEVGFVSRAEFSRLMLSEPSISILILRVLAAEVRTARMALATA
jgi:CRP-like cAMP-binding protein